MSANPAPAIPTSVQERIDLIEQSFSAQTVPTVPLPLTYRLGLLLLCGLMIILPLVYLALIALACYGLYYHASFNATLLESGSIKVALIAYFAPLIIGLILIFFMVKPLFAPKAKHAQPVQLQPGAEPILEAFVNRICDAVQAPKPRSIAIDGQVNASASFEDGILAFFLGRLRLTVGLPLLAGMPTHSVGGVLAHEFGHFAQGGGMRLTYIIRMINNWFARVVYGRDSWDESIERNSQDSDYRIMILLLIARAFIFLVRKILWALMQIGHIASCYMARQMEYDADSYEVRFAGTPVFAQTSERLSKLGWASQMAISQLQGHFETKRLSDDLPSYIEHCRTTFTPEQLKTIDEAQAGQKTKLLDTHPCDADRIAHANKLNATGIFHLDQPATLLLQDYQASAREVTRHHYTEVFGLDTTQIKLLDNEQINAAQNQLNAELAAAKSFLHGTCTIELPLQLSPLDDDSPVKLAEQQSPAEPHATHGNTGNPIQSQDQTSALSLQSSASYAALKSSLAALQSHAFDSKEFHASVDEAYKKNTSRYFDQLPGKYGALARDASQAFTAYAAVYAQQLQSAEEKTTFTARYELFRKACEVVPEWFKIRNDFVLLQIKLSRWQNSEATEAEINAAVRTNADPITASLRTVLEAIGKETPLPFADEDTQLTAHAYLYAPSIQTGHPITDAYHQASHFLEKFHTFYHRLLGKLALDLASLENPTPEPDTEEPQLV